MFGSLLKVALSPLDIALSAAVDVVDVVTCNTKKELGENTGNSLNRLLRNIEETFED